MITTTGVDYSTGRPSPASIHDRHHVFAVRYLAPDPAHPSAKSLTRAEYLALVAAGVSVPLVFESYSKRALGGFPAGVADARTANADVAALGLAPLDVDRPVYFAIDFQPANATEMAAAMAYIRGAASIRGAKRTGVYGGYAEVKACLDHGLCTWAWQTRAWSRYGGIIRWDSRAHMRQVGSETIGAYTVDSNIATVRDFGQFPKPAPVLSAHDLHMQHIHNHPPAKPTSLAVHPAALRVGYSNPDVRVYQAALRRFAANSGINVALVAPSGVTGSYGSETAHLTEAVYRHLAAIHHDPSWLKGDTTTPGPKLLRLIGLGVE